MASLFKRPVWSLEEAVLLAEASEGMAFDAVSVDDFLNGFSSRLRNGAERDGVTISDNFRNPEDVRENLRNILTMRRMSEYFDPELLDGTIHREAALLKKNDPDGYYRILELAQYHYPVEECTVIDDDKETSFEEPTEIVADSKGEYSVKRHKRPRIRSMYVNNGFSDNGGSYYITFPPSDVKSEKSSTLTIDDENSEIEKSSKKAFEPGGNESQNETETKARQKSKSDRLLEQVKEILVHSFPRGFRLDSALESKRFRNAFRSSYKAEVPCSDELLQIYIKSSGLLFDKKVYVEESLMTSEMKKNIEDYIKETFANKRKYIYYGVLFENFKDMLLESKIADVDMFRTFLEYNYGTKWSFMSSYMARHEWIKPSVKDEMISYVRDRGSVVSFDELQNSLDFIPSEKVKHEWDFNGGLLVSNGRNEKFHIDSFYITTDQMDSVVRNINSALSSTPFITGDQLLEELRLQTPEIFDNNSEISDLGIRNYFASRLQNKFSFRNNLISHIEDSFEGPAAMVAYCKNKGSFSMSEAEDMAKLIGSSINFYLERILDVSIRINDTDFIPRNKVIFNVDAIDKALDMFFEKESYVPINGFNAFEAFPSCGEYPWHPRLLESYLLTSSKKYKFLHPQYLSKETMAGAIVAKESELNSYEELLTYALSSSGINLTEEESNEYLYDIGLVAVKRKNGQVKKLLAKAKTYRNKINLNKQ